MIRTRIQNDTVGKPEFEIGDTVTLDRYNHIDDVIKVEVTSYGQMPFSKRLTYRLARNGWFICETTGGSIMESKDYKPADDKDRHEKIFRKND